MATTYEEVFQTIFEKATANNLLVAMSDDALKITRLSDPEAAAYLGVGHSTLAHKRSEQAALPEKQRDPGSIGSIQNFPGPPVAYRLYDLLKFRLAEEPGSGVVKPRSEQAKEKAAATFKANAPKRAKEDQERRTAAVNSTYRGFSAFMQAATGADTWPFSIQSDGRPLDLYSAILDSKLTGNAERLNLQEFANRLAYAASNTHSDQEADEIALGTPQPEQPVEDPTAKPGRESGKTTL